MGELTLEEPIAGKGAAGSMEPLKGNNPDTQRSERVLTKQQRIAELAREHPQMAFTSLNQYLDEEWLAEAVDRVRADSAPGVDGQTLAGYKQGLGERLRDLLNRAKSGRYVAPPVKRVYIPKDGGKETRPIGMPTIENKVLERAVVMLLEPIYEQDFKPFSCGFRPGRSAHQALELIWRQVMTQNTGWILDVDIRKFFDTLGHRHLREILQHRVKDGVILRLIGKWLNAGILEGTQLTYPTEGTPQGGVISPLLSNIYLHEVLDRWWDEMVQPALRGKAFLVRYADDFVMGFELKSDAERVYRVIFKRFEKFGLSLHPDKTRLVPFGRPGGTQGETPTPPQTFDFLGFTHYWGKSRKGRWTVARKTSRKRFNRSLKVVYQWCKEKRHEPLRWQVEKLGLKLKGHFGYYGITGNFRSLQAFRWRVISIWRIWLDRRSREHGSMPWERMHRLLDFWYIPPARVVHSAFANPCF
jgi:group II intron reverse transcriptase/maturase